MELPPLPKPPVNDFRGMFDEAHCVRYTADQLRSYASECIRLAVEEERERCAKLCEENIVQTSVHGPKSLTPYYAESQARHDGQAYAVAIRKAPLE